jgi:hypothetical protein
MSITIPPGVGPHEDRECDLMLAGHKPMAMFCEVADHSGYFPEEVFAPYLSSGQIVRREEFYLRAQNGVLTRCLFYSLPGQEWRMEAAHMVQEAIFTGIRRSTEEDDVQLGRLLGYTDAEIASFLEHARRS